MSQNEVSQNEAFQNERATAAAAAATVAEQPPDTDPPQTQHAHRDNISRSGETPHSDVCIYIYIYRAPTRVISSFRGLSSTFIGISID